MSASRLVEETCESLLTAMVKLEQMGNHYEFINTYYSYQVYVYVEWLQLSINDQSDQLLVIYEHDVWMVVIDLDDPGRGTILVPTEVRKSPWTFASQ